MEPRNLQEIKQALEEERRERRWLRKELMYEIESLKGELRRLREMLGISTSG